MKQRARTSGEFPESLEAQQPGYRGPRKRRKKARIFGSGSGGEQVGGGGSTGHAKWEEKRTRSNFCEGRCNVILGVMRCCDPWPIRCDLWTDVNDKRLPDWSHAFLLDPRISRVRRDLVKIDKQLVNWHDLQHALGVSKRVHRRNGKYYQIYEYCGNSAAFVGHLVRYVI